MRQLAAVLGVWAALCAPATAQDEAGTDSARLAVREHAAVDTAVGTGTAGLAAEALAAVGEPAAAGREAESSAARPIGRGLASWYGPRFHGRRTASGEAFDMHELTAAHPTLPFGTLVQVTSLVNGRAVQVRINDRGPYVGRRIIDLSRAAAVALGLVQSGRGVKPVSLAVVER